MASATRVLMGRNSVEPKLKAALTARNHMLDNLFSEMTLAMKKKPKAKKDSDDKESESSAKPLELDEDGYLTVERTGVMLKSVSLHLVIYIFRSFVMIVTAWSRRSCLYEK